MSFECTKCGACCRLAGSVAELEGYDRGDSACKHLTPDNLCEIYDARPRICRMDAMHSPVMTTPEWHRRNSEACERLHLHVYGQPLSR